MHLVPAYGHDYKSAREVKAAWDANKDFKIADISSPHDGRYINKQDAPKGTHNIRYGQLTKVCVITVK